MAKRSPQTQAKRQREFAKAEKRREKAERRVLRKALKSQAPGETADVAEGENVDNPEQDASKSRPSRGL